MELYAILYMHTGPFFPSQNRIRYYILKGIADQKGLKEIRLGLKEVRSLTFDHYYIHRFYNTAGP